MKNTSKSVLFGLGCIIGIFFLESNAFAWEGMPLPRLHVEGRYLKDPHGNVINLHGYAQTFSPWFNEQGTKWNNYDVDGCLTYNQDIIDRVLDAGWKMNFVRMHMDPYWSSTPGCQGRYEGEECFNETRFVKYLDEVFVPMAEYAVSKGLYVIFRPPGVAPEQIEVGGVYHQYLLKVWGIIANHRRLRNHPNIMFELANEPINILGPDGTYGANSQGHFDNLKTYFQEIVDTIRTTADNILWIPGLGYQSLYQGFAVNPIEGEDIGYAVHVYPGWFNSGEGYEPFQRGWNEQVQPVADFAPIVVTEMDWAPEKYGSSWGKGITGTAGGEGFGANFKKITDNAGNVSWLLFTEPHLLANFTGEPPAGGEDFTFLNDPEACPWPVYHWYQGYADEYQPRPEFDYLAQSDNGDGTFANPVIRGDFPAPLVVRAGDTYYLVSENPGFFPGSTVLESKDLVNWKYSPVAVENIPVENVMWIDEEDAHSGTLVETQTGEWWAMISYDEGPLGRFPQLLPVTWTAEDPVVNQTAKDAEATPKPDVGRDYYPTSLATNDVFRHYKPGLQWEWKDEPDHAGWSLLDRAGYFRLNTTNVTEHLNEAENILTQRILTYSGSTYSYGTIRMEIDNMLEGDVAGLSIFQDTDAYIGVQATGGKKQLVVSHDGVHTGPEVAGTAIYLRIVVNYETGKASFYYSFDNNDYSQLGSEITLSSDPAVGSGNRFGIFNFATTETGGFVDIDWFSSESWFSEDEFYPAGFESYTEESLTLTDLVVEGGDHITVLTSGVTKIEVQAVFADGHMEDVSARATYANHDPEVMKISRGHIVSLKDGEASLDIEYTGPLGETKQKSLQVTSTTFPLTNKLFNPDIWEDGSFDETTNTLHTGQWGFGGWQYDGVDLSDYKYIVVRLGSENNASVDFRLFDGSSYWGSPASYSFEDNQEIVVMLDHAVKEDGSPLNSEHIYIAGFWSTGGAPFVIDTVFLTNSSEYDPPAVFAKDAEGNDLEKLEGFTYLQDEGPSPSQSFMVSGELLSESVAIESSVDFEISLDETGGYSQNITLDQNEGQVAETPVYVRLKSGFSQGDHTGSITLTSAGALTKTISLSGAVDRVTAIDDPYHSNITVVSTWYFTLMGQRIQNIENRKGVFIIRQLLADGTLSSRKIYKGY